MEEIKIRFVIILALAIMATAIVATLVGVKAYEKHTSRPLFIEPNVLVSRNSLSWDAALISMAAGGLERRISWNWDNRFVLAYNPLKTHLNLNKMKLVMCFSSQCDRKTAESWKPAKGDKSASDWVPSVQDSTKEKGKMKNHSYKGSTPELKELKFSFRNFDLRLEKMEKKVKEMLLKEKTEKMMGRN